MTTAVKDATQQRGLSPAHRQVKSAQDSRTVLRVRKQSDEVKWPYQSFSKYLDGLMMSAGVPLSLHGTPNTSVFEEITGIDSGRVSRWRQGKHQPTTESLRQIAETLGPRVGVDAAELLILLEVKAGRRSEAEGQAVGVSASQAAPAVDDIDRRIRIIKIALDRPGISVEEREELEIELMRARTMKRMNEDGINSIDKTLRRYGHTA